MAGKNNGFRAVARRVARFGANGFLVLLGAAHAAEMERTALVAPGDLTEARLMEWREDGYRAVALMLTGSDTAVEKAAAEKVGRANHALDYWLEIGRDAQLADAHPEWMASLQTHEEWRRFFPDFPRVEEGDVVKVYPWVPVLYRETFAVHLRKVQERLRGLPTPRRIYLNDLQGAPSACGCGHHLCRWTTDYGPIRTANRLPATAAGDFVAAVKREFPSVEVIPVWATECEAHDREGLCGGVGCYDGACWREWTAQLTPLSEQAPVLAALLPYRAFQRDLPVYGEPGSWIARALDSFHEMPARYGAEGVPTRRLVAVVQGWDVSSEQVEAQVNQARKAGTPKVVVAWTPIPQGWEPRLFRGD